MSGSNQSTLFDPMTAEIDVVLQHAEDETDAMDDHVWPKTLAELVDVLADDHITQGMDAEDAAVAARRTVAVMAHHFGARMVYLPRDKTLRLALRDNMIWHKFCASTSPRRINDLAVAYDMSDQQMYNIIKAQKKLTIKRTQYDLFDANKQEKKHG